MKRAFYIFCFTVLGVLLLFLAYALLEMSMLAFLLNHGERYVLGLRWSQWYAVFDVLRLLFLIVGVTLGFRWGVRWWQIIYVEKRHRQRVWWRRRKNAS